jgi:hypothetical protein
MFWFPILLGTILLVVKTGDYEYYYQGNLVPLPSLPEPDPVSTASLIVWIITGTGFGLLMVLNELSKHWVSIFRVRCLKTNKVKE